MFLHELSIIRIQAYFVIFVYMFSALKGPRMNGCSFQLWPGRNTTMLSDADLARQ